MCREECCGNFDREALSFFRAQNGDKSPLEEKKNHVCEEIGCLFGNLRKRPVRGRARARRDVRRLGLERGDRELRGAGESHCD